MASAPRLFLAFTLFMVALFSIAWPSPVIAAIERLNLCRSGHSWLKLTHHSMDVNARVEDR